MTVLKVLCITSFIGGLVPVVASSGSLKPANSSLTDFFVIDESDPFATSDRSTSVSPSAEFTRESVYEPHHYRVGLSVLRLLDDVFDALDQPSVLPNPVSRSYVDTPIHTIGINDFGLSMFLPEEDHGQTSANQDFSISSQADLDSGELDLNSSDEPMMLKSQNLIAAIAPLNDSIDSIPTVDVVSASVEKTGLSILQAPIQLDVPNPSSQPLSTLRKCSLTPLPLSPSSSSSEAPQALTNRNDAQAISQVVVDEKVVAEFVDEAYAINFAEAIKALLKPDYFRPDELEVRPNGDVYLIATQDLIIMQVTADSVPTGYNPALTAIAWTNNLRVALGAKPLSMGESQAQIQALEANGQEVNGIASWYGPYFHGRLTASGERFDQNELTAAHPTLPFDTYLNVTNLKNGRTVVVRINDRGPYIGRRSLDLSRRAAQCLGSEHIGVVPYSATLLSVKPTEATQVLDVAETPVLGNQVPETAWSTAALN
ncbi:MAG: septal ring lytic transglycosylase RlpA family protein [Cyanobacteria bacterium J06626_14]